MTNTLGSLFTRFGNSIINLVDSKVTAYDIEVENAIADLKDDIDDAVEDEGGVIPTPTGTLNITENGTYNVTNYASANVSVSGGGSSLSGIPREVVDGFFRAPTSSFSFSLPSNATDIYAYALSYAFQYSTGIESADLSSLTSVSGQYALISAFNSCTNLTSIDLSNLITINGTYPMMDTFRSCTGLTSVDLSSLTTVGGTYPMYGTFNGCTGLTSVDLSSLTTINNSYSMQQTFYGCTGLTSVEFSSLTTITSPLTMYETFGYTRLSSLSFPALNSNSFGSATNQFNRMLTRVSGCTVHFPSNLQSVIGSWSDVTSGFGGTNTTVLFDLPATT